MHFLIFASQKIQKNVFFVLDPNIFYHVPQKKMEKREGDTLMSLFLSHFTNPQVKSIKPSNLIDEIQASWNIAFAFVSTKSKQWDTTGQMKVTSKNSDGSVTVRISTC